MDDRAAVCWIHRRAGFGLAPDALEAAIGRGPDAEIDALTSPDAVVSASGADPWDDATLPFERDRTAAIAAVTGWLDLMVETTTPLVDRLAWFWHGHFVSALDKVKVARLMVQQIRLFRTHGLGSFADLLAAVTVDPAMLIYLDGDESTGDHPNENYGREVLELFTLGVGTYTEADVQAGAAALTGWKVRPATGQAQFIARRHDDTPRTYLGSDGVHDVETVVAALVANESLSTFIASNLAVELLGTSEADVVQPLAAALAEGGLDIAALVRATLRAGIAGASRPVVLAPVPWLAIAQRVTGAILPARVRLAGLRTAGQVPMTPPNVAGWPGGAAWFGSSTVVSRAALAAAIAAATPAESAVLRAAANDDPVALATALGLPDPAFDAASTAALAAASPGVQRLALALCTPEFVIA